MSQTNLRRSVVALSWISLVCAPFTTTQGPSSTGDSGRPCAAPWCAATCCPAVHQRTSRWACNRFRHLLRTAKRNKNHEKTDQFYFWRSMRRKAVRTDGPDAAESCDTIMQLIKLSARFLSFSAQMLMAHVCGIYRRENFIPKQS